MRAWTGKKERDIEEGGTNFVMTLMMIIIIIIIIIIIYIFVK